MLRFWTVGTNTWGQQNMCILKCEKTSSKRIKDYI